MQNKNFASFAQGCASLWLGNTARTVAGQMLLALAFLTISAPAWAAAPVISPPANTTILEDAGRTNLTFTVTDEDTPFFAVSVVARSSNTNLVPAANLAIVGSGTTRNVGITTRTNASGSATISLIANDGTSSVTNSFVLTVTAVNDAPVLGALSALTILEDAAPTNRPVLLTDVDSPIAFVILTATSGDTNLVNTTLSGSGTNRTLRLLPVTNAFGSTTITLIANDGSLRATNTFALTITPVNDAPYIAPLTNMTVLEDSAPTVRTVTVSDVDDAITNVTVNVTSSNTGVATVGIAGTSGSRTLTITPVADAFGVTTVRLVADDGNKSSTNSFTFTVTSVNDAPSFELSTNLITLAEDAGVQVITNFATTISSGPTNEATQTNLFLVTTTNLAFFAVPPAITPLGNLSFRTATNVVGTNVVSVVLRDSGGTNSGGVNLSSAATFEIVVTNINDAPVIATIPNFSIREDAGTTNRNFLLTDIDTTISSVTVEAISSNTNLVTVSTSGLTTNRVLSITTVSNANGLATITLIADDGTDVSTNSFVLTVLAVNDRPTFDLSTNTLTVLEDSGAFTLSDFATNMVSGPDDESGQTNFFVLTVTNAAAFYLVAPAISPDGTLTFTPRTNAFGTNNISVALRDNGGTNLAGLNTSLPQTFRVIVTPVNDAPAFTGLTNFTILEDRGTTNRNFRLTDVDTVITNVTVIASSSDTNIVNVSVSGTTTNRVLSITTVTNAFGTADITLIANDGTDTATNTITLTVEAVNDAPYMLILTNLTVMEDSGDTVRTVIVNDVDTAITNVTVTATSSNTNITTVEISGTDTNRTLTLSPVTNAFGPVTVFLVANDGARSATNTFLFTVVSVNDPPSFALSTNEVTVAEDSSLTTITSFATGIAAGPSNESSQTNLFILTSTNTAFFATQPAISPSGTLTFRPNTNVFGTNEITVVVRDSGGTNNGGVNLSGAQTFNIVVTPVNDAPTMTGLTNLTIREDIGTTNRTFILRDVDTDISTVTVSATSSDTNLVTVAASGTTTNRTLAITTVTNANGSATITLVADDGTATTTNSFALVVSAVNDAPSFTLETNTIVVLEDSGAFSLDDFATNMVVGPDDESAQTNFFVLTVTNAAVFYLVPPAISPTGTLTFTPRTNVFGTNNISVVMRDSGGTNLGGANTSAAQTFRIIVSPENDAPVITGLSAFTILEDRGTTNRNFMVTDVDTLISNVTVTATSSDTNIVNVTVTGTTTNRTLSMTTVTNAFGAPTITLVASDGINLATNSFVLTVTAVNDAPHMLTLTNLTVLEDSGAAVRTVFVTDVDHEITDVIVTATSSNTNVATVEISGSDTNRTLTISPLTNAFGAATVTLVASDGDRNTTNSFVFTVTAVNDQPGFALSTNLVTVVEDSALQSVANFATSISSGPSNESTQTNLFIVTTTNTAFFATQPAISPSGTLTFRPNTNIFGTNELTVVMRDSGGTNNGGINLSEPETFTIVVTGVNDAPVISGIAAFSINEDRSTNRVFTLTDVDTDISTVTVSATSSDTNLVTVATSGTTTNRTLEVTTVTNAFGSATITLVADDGTDTSTNTFTLTVNSANDAPTFAFSTNNVVVTKYTTVMTVTNFISEMSVGPTNENGQTWTFLVTAGNTNSFVVQPAISTNGTLTFQAKDVAGAATVSVRMQDNGGTANGGTNTSPAQTFTVTVPANPYIPLSGQYNGLFYETNGVVNASAGFMSFTLATNGTYSGYILLAGGANAFTGQFDIAGTTETTITSSGGNIALAMALDLTTNFTESATGTLTHSNFTSVLTVDRATFNALWNPAFFAGEYNIVVPGSGTPASLPGGHGFGLVSVGWNGILSLTGELSDGTEISQTVSVSRDGIWPLYVSLYNGEGLVLGWVTFATTSTTDLSGDATWIKESTVGGSFYSGGFTNDLTISGSYYFEPELGLPVLEMSGGEVILTGGNLSSAITNTVTLNFDHTITVNPAATNGLSLTIDLANGTFSGQFTHPDLLSTKQLNGVLLQRSTNAVGYFLGDDQSGSIILK